MIETLKNGEESEIRGVERHEIDFLLYTSTKNLLFFQKNPADFPLHINLVCDIISYPSMTNCPTLPARGRLMWAFER